ncbi:unnamed protein product, partial [Thlaspi arvense]
FSHWQKKWFVFLGDRSVTNIAGEISAFVVFMGEREFLVLCYWNGCTKFGPDGVYYEGSVPKMISVKQNTELSRFLDVLYLVTGLDKQRSKLDIIGRYPVPWALSISPNPFWYVSLPVVNDNILKTMLELPSKHPSINSVEMYLQVKRTSGGVIDPAASENPTKRHRTQQTQEANGSVDANVTHLGPEDLGSEFLADEIERVVRVQPTVSVPELKKWWKEKTGCEVETLEMKEAKMKAVTKIYGDRDESYRVFPKLVAALQSSNGLVVDWQYDLLPKPELASFRGVFWAFSQCLEGFPHCRPLILVNTKDLNGMTLMVASGVDADNCIFHLAFAVTKELSVDTWRWFFRVLRQKVTQRQGLCLMSSPHPDILTVVKEPGSQWQEPWAYHRFCLDHLCSEFHDVFQDEYLKNLVHEAGCTAHEDEFDIHMKDVEKRNPMARRWLDQFHPQQWALAHDGGRRYGYTDLEESFQFEASDSIELLGLTVPMLSLFDEIRNHFAISCWNIRGPLRRGYQYSTLVMEKIEEFRTASVTYTITTLLDRDVFHVAEPSKTEEWLVQLSNWFCTCGDFAAKFPCLHALAVCEKLKINPLVYVDDCYTLERCQKSYSAEFNTVPQVSAWPEAFGVPSFVPPFLPDESSMT